jgi:hypothetical protein
MDSKPDFEHGIYRVTHFLVRGNARYTCESDMIFIDDRRAIVLEWTGPEENYPPTVTVSLDPSRLAEMPNSPGYFLYNGDVVDPRTQH